MSFQWKLVAGFLYFEIALIFILLLPLVSPRKWQTLFNTSPIQRMSRRSSMYFYVVLTLLSLFLIDSIRDMNKYSTSRTNKLLEEGNYTHEMKNSLKLFRAQRNFYITFFAIFLFYILRRIVTMIDIQASLINKSEAIIKEAEQTKDLACKTVKDHENLILLEKDNQENVVNGLQDQIRQLQLECEKLTNEKSSLLEEQLNFLHTIDSLKLGLFEVDVQRISEHGHD